MAKVCIVTTAHICNNPRVVKEADALTVAGHEVVVLAVRNDEACIAYDNELMGKRDWILEVVDYRKPSFLWLLSGLRKAICTRLSKFISSFGIAENAFGRVSSELRRLAKRYEADLYIAHHVDALAPTYAVAKKYDAKYSFDVEDYHAGEADRSDYDVFLIEYIEQKYLPGAAYISFASPCFAEVFNEKYELRMKLETILNVFPLEDLAQPDSETHKPPRLYWYSQVIGPGRGIENVLEAMAQVEGPCELYLRGKISPEYRESLNQMTTRLDLCDRVMYLNTVAPDDLLQNSIDYDIGLALEQMTCENRDLCLTNKICFYLLSGLAILATSTKGQKEMMSRIPGAGLLCQVNDIESMTDALKALLSDMNKLKEFKSSSRRYAVEEYNWEVESKKLLDIISETVS